jgi:hypothetical protein
MSHEIAINNNLVVKKLRHYLLDDLFMLCGGIFLVEKGFTYYLLELVRNFLYIVVISSCFMVILV